MRDSTGRARPSAAARPARPAAAPERRLPARTTDELIQSVLVHLGGHAHALVAVVGITGERIDAVRVSDLSDGEPPVLAAIQLLLQHSDVVSMVVFTEQTLPQWVAQPCHLLRDVVLAGTNDLPPENDRRHAVAEDCTGDGW